MSEQRLACWPAEGLNDLLESQRLPMREWELRHSRANAYYAEGRRWRPISDVWPHGFTSPENSLVSVQTVKMSKRRRTRRTKKKGN